MFKTIKENFFTQKFTALVTMPLLVFVLAIISLFVSSCDKGIDSVGFDYYMDANDRRVVHFNAKGQSDFGSFEYTWSFGDGSTGQGKDITHEFSDFGKFTVILTATIEDSKIETTVSKEIEVVIPKITDLDFEVVPDKQNPRLYNFKAVSNTDYGNVEYEWDFGDGMTASGETVQYGFEYFGTYEIGLKAKISEYEKIESIRKKYVEIAAPAITRLEFYAEQDDDDPFLFHFKPIAEATWGTLEYEWSFGDGKIAYDIEEPTNTYGKYASYNVQLKAKIKETGATRTVNQEVTVQPPVFKNYEITYTLDPNDPLQVYFVIENKDGESEDMSQQDSFMWEFGDGNTSSGLRVNYRYESYGEKTVYVTLRTAQQTQKTLTKTFTLETPHINNIKITGTPSMKAGNIIEYRVSADSEFSDEIEYSWEFEDGTQKAGRAVQREMSFWSVANDSGNITENIYIKASIPRLNVSVKETKEVQVVRPTIKNFKIHCVNSPNNNLEWICDTRGLGENVTSSHGGDIEYEWVFNGQTYTGANQRFKFDAYEASYTITATAKIEDTNITETDTFTAYARLDGIGFGCTSKTLDSNNPDALKLECTAYDLNGTHSGTSILWDFGENSDKYFRDESEHTYEKAGTYPVTMKFKSNQLIKPIEITQDYTVLVNVSSYFDRGSKSGTADCGGRQTDGKYTVYRNNFDLFNQEDFTITNVFSTGNTNCSCNGAGWNFTDNVWHGWDEKSADCWGNIDQWVNTTICAKADPTKCVKNY